jgi:hypothetical protein
MVTSARAEIYLSPDIGYATYHTFGGNGLALKLEKKFLPVLIKDFL